MIDTYSFYNKYQFYVLMCNMNYLYIFYSVLIMSLKTETNNSIMYSSILTDK